MNIAVILAAGQSQRLGKIDKIFLKIKNRPLIFYTIQQFEKNPNIKKIILVVRKKKTKEINYLIRKYNFKKISSVIKGGKERQDSAFCGLLAAKKTGAGPKDIILFHNGGNPLVSQKEIDKIIKEARRYKAALLAQPLKDTLKIEEKSFVKKTIPRKNLWLAQTPQAIEYSLAEKAFQKAKKDRFYGTDDVSLVERMKKKVKIVPCSYKNIKITNREDIEIVKKLLKN